MPLPPFLADLRRHIGHALVLLPTVVVIARDGSGRLLLVHDRDAGQWTLPGGIVEPGQTPADAAVREVWEEARVHATLTGLAGVVGGPGCETQYRNGDRIAWVATIFHATAAGSAPVADGDEASDARFFTPPEQAALQLRADTVRFLQAAQQGGAGGYFEPARWQPGPRPPAAHGPTPEAA